MHGSDAFSELLPKQKRHRHKARAVRTRGNFLLAETVSDRNTVALCMERRKIIVAGGQVKMRFRAYENILRHIEPDASAKMAHKLGLRVVGGATRVVVAGVVIIVEADILHADAAQHFSADSRRYTGQPHAVHIPEKRPEGLIPLVGVLGCAPVKFRLQPELLVQQDVKTESGVRTSANRLRGVIGRIRRARTGWRRQRADAERSVNLLGLRRRCRKEEEKEEKCQ
jgi:hypothetical protein